MQFVIIAKKIDYSENECRNKIFHIQNKSGNQNFQYNNHGAILCKISIAREIDSIIILKLINIKQMDKTKIIVTIQIVHQIITVKTIANLIRI